MLLSYYFVLLFKNLLLTLYKIFLRVTKNFYLAIFGLDFFKTTIFFIFKQNIRYRSSDFMVCRRITTLTRFIGDWNACACATETKAKITTLTRLFLPLANSVITKNYEKLKLILFLGLRRGDWNVSF